MSSNSQAINAIATKKCISMTTFKKDGTAVASPIWFNVIGDKIFVTTPRATWKVKRVGNNPRVEFATCTQRGKVTGPTFTGTARVIPDSELAPVLRAKRRRYLSARFIQLMPSTRDQVAIEITPDQ